MLHATEANLSVVVWDDLDEPARAALSLPEGDNRTMALQDLSGARWAEKGPAERLTWYGAPSIAAVNDRLSRGWPEGAARISEIAAREIADPVALRRRRRRADQGDELDIQSVYRGDLSRAWTRTRRAPRSAARAVTIVISLGALSGVVAEQLFWRGAAALRLAQSLERSGYQVAIWASSPAEDVDTLETLSVVQFVRVKDRDQPLDVDRLAAVTAMPGYFRTRLFAGRAWACQQANRKIKGNKGATSHALIPAALRLAHGSLPGRCVVQDPILSGEEAAAWVAKAMEQIESAAQEADVSE